MVCKRAGNYRKYVYETQNETSCEKTTQDKGRKINLEGKRGGGSSVTNGEGELPHRRHSQLEGDRCDHTPQSFPSFQLGTATLAGWLAGGKSCLSRVCPRYK